MEKNSLAYFTNMFLAKKQPCIVYYRKKVYMTFDSRESCASHFGKSSSAISSAIARKGGIIVGKERYYIRNYNPNKK